MQVNIIRKYAPIDMVQIELSEIESSTLAAMLQNYHKNCCKVSDPSWSCSVPDYCFLTELLDKLLWKRT